MKQRRRRLVAVLIGFMAVGVATAAAARWTEDDFYRKGSVARPFVFVSGTDPQTTNTVIGSARYYTPQKGDTFLDLARFFGLGYNEFELANPGVDAWIPPENQTLLVPTEWILPHAPHSGIVINIPEMRIYYYLPRKGSGPEMVTTFPVGLGRDEWRTPQGKFKVRGKTTDPVWNIPETIQKERIAEKGWSEKSIGPGPDNPLGKYRMELTLPMYMIHGTNIPWGVGMQVSHGCVRLYPEDIEQLFPTVPIGTPGEFVYQPVKIGARDGRIYAEVHKDIYGHIPAMFHEARRIILELGWQDRVDVGRLERAIEEQSGVVTDITAGGAAEMREERLRSATGGEKPES